MPLKFLIDFLTGSPVIVNVPATGVTPITPLQGNPIGLLLTLTYANDQ